jgi:hypothetical protein
VRTAGGQTQLQEGLHGSDVGGAAAAWVATSSDDSVMTGGSANNAAGSGRDGGGAPFGVGTCKPATPTSLDEEAGPTHTLVDRLDVMAAATAAAAVVVGGGPTRGARPEQRTGAGVTQLPGNEGGRRSRGGSGDSRHRDYYDQDYTNFFA